MIPSMQSEWPRSGIQKTSSGMDVGKSEPLYTVGGSANYCSHFGNQSRGSQKVEAEQLYDPAISLLGIHPNTLS